MGKHRKPGPPSEDRRDRAAFHVELKRVPVYPCEHTGRVVVGGRTVCAGCPKDYGPVEGEQE